jgi:hypothetical protein
LIPPIFVFSGTGEWRDVRFLGMAVPGGPDIENFDDLVAVCRSSEGLRFQNYRARFTILDVSEISRDWIDDLIQRRDPFAHAPGVWADWVLTGRCRPLKAVRYRTSKPIGAASRSARRSGDDHRDPRIF